MPCACFNTRNTISTCQSELQCEGFIYMCKSGGKNGGKRKDKWRTRNESQRRYEERTVRVGVGSGMVARVTVRVVTPYVNPPIWSILQSKRIGFLWRWISSAGRLSLCLYLSSPQSNHCTFAHAFFPSSSFLCFHVWLVTWLDFSSFLLSSLGFLLLCLPSVLL